MKINQTYNLLASSETVGTVVDSLTTCKWRKTGSVHFEKEKQKIETQFALKSIKTLVKTKEKDRNGVSLPSSQKKKRKEGRRGKGISQKEGNQKHAAASFDCLVNLDVRFTERRIEWEENKKDKRQKQRSSQNYLCCFDLLWYIIADSFSTQIMIPDYQILFIWSWTSLF